MFHLRLCVSPSILGLAVNNLLLFDLKGDVLYRVWRINMSVDELLNLFSTFRDLFVTNTLWASVKEDFTIPSCLLVDQTEVLFYIIRFTLVFDWLLCRILCTSQRWSPPRFGCAADEVQEQGADAVSEAQVFPVRGLIFRQTCLDTFARSLVVI